MSEGISYKQILHEHDKFHTKAKSSKGKALHKHKPLLTGKTQKEQMSKANENINYQRKIGRAWND